MSLQADAAHLFNIVLTDAQASAFVTYARELVAWNAHTNLTAISDADGIHTRHFLDSLSLFTAFTPRPEMRVIDIGTGAGFPGLAIKIAAPQLQVTLLEATGKKVAFLDHVIQTLEVTGVDTLHARAEDAGHLAAHRAAYDVVTARAVARLPILLEYMLPLAKIGGLCIAMKGKTAQAEADDSAAALKTLGGELRAVRAVTLPTLDDAHYLVVVEKTAPTPRDYPRKPGIPTKNPL
jgi:16S rRNA (guanine527-N7)-methyltransferase